MLDEYLLNFWLLKMPAQNAKRKKKLGPLKVKSVPTDECIFHKMNIETFDYNTESWVGEAISKE